VSTMSLPYDEDPWDDPDLEALETAASRWRTGAEPSGRYEEEMFAVWAAEARGEDGGMS
jgi:hypothetical protein